MFKEMPVISEGLIRCLRDASSNLVTSLASQKGLVVERIHWLSVKLKAVKIVGTLFH